MERYDGSSRLDGINDKTYEILFKDKDISKDDLLRDMIDTLALSVFTKKKGVLDILTLTELKSMSLLLKVYTGDFFKITTNKNEKENHAHYTYERGEEKFDFNTLSNTIEGSREMKKELTSWNRQGKCHSESMGICYSLKGSSLVTGRMVGENYDIIHSVVSIMIGDEEYVIDYTRNLIMSYKDYKRLFNYEEITRIERESVAEDIENKYIADLHVSSKVYCACRDELMSDLSKNIAVFKKI